MKYEYSVRIAWSDGEGAYLAMVPELPGCVADGATLEEALANVKQIAAEWVEVAKEEGRQVPPPVSVEDEARAVHQLQNEMNAQVGKAIEQAVQEVVKKISESESAPERWAFHRPLVFESD